MMFIRITDDISRSPSPQEVIAAFKKNLSSLRIVSSEHGKMDEKQYSSLCHEALVDTLLFLVYITL